MPSGNSIRAPQDEQACALEGDHSRRQRCGKDFFDGEDFSFKVYKPNFQNDILHEDYIYNLELSVEAEGIMAWEMFSDLKDALISQGCKCDFRVRIDI